MMARVELRQNFNVFSFSLSFQGDDGLVCRKCWCKVEIFHSFYLHIESRHSSLQDRSQIYVSSINDFESVNDEKGGVSEIIVNECSSALDVDWNHDSYDDVKVETLPKRKVKANEKKFANRLIKTNAIEKTRSASNKIFKYEEKLIISKGEIHSRFSSLYCRCDSCSLLFLSRSKLYAHIKNEHLALVKWLQCYFKIPIDLLDLYLSTAIQVFHAKMLRKFCYTNAAGRACEKDARKIAMPALFENAAQAPIIAAHTKLP